MMGAASFKFLVADHVLLCLSESEQQIVTRGSFNMNKVELLPLLLLTNKCYFMNNALSLKLCL